MPTIVGTQRILPRTNAQIGTNANGYLVKQTNSEDPMPVSKLLVTIAVSSTAGFLAGLIVGPAVYDRLGIPANRLRAHRGVWGFVDRPSTDVANEEIERVRRDDGSGTGRPDEGRSHAATVAPVSVNL